MFKQIKTWRPTCTRRIVNIISEGSWGWKCQAGGLEEDRRGARRGCRGQSEMVADDWLPNSPKETAKNLNSLKYWVWNELFSLIWDKNFLIEREIYFHQTSKAWANHSSLSVVRPDSMTEGRLALFVIKKVRKLGFYDLLYLLYFLHV